MGLRGTLLSHAILGAALWTTMTWAAIGPETLPPLETQIQSLEAKRDTLQKEIAARSLALHAARNASHRPRFVWQDTDSRDADRRAFLLKLLETDLKNHLQQFGQMESQIASLNSELQWQQARANLGSSESGPLPRSKRGFRCRVEPVSPQGTDGMILDQDFGRHQDSETGLVWMSSGWWVSRLSSDVRACQEGTVAFVGDITGRGRVILVEHSGGALTLYANLQPETVTSLTKGVRVPAGHRLGTAREKFYFEVREAGEATNPRLALGKSLLEKMSIQATIE